MEDPWAAWGTPKKAAASSSVADAMRMPRMSMSPPPPEPGDLDPWAKPTPSVAKATTPPAPPSLSRSPSPTKYSPASPSKLAESALASPPLTQGLAFSKPPVELGSGWDDVGWGAPPKSPRPGLSGESRMRVRSPSPDLEGGWGSSPANEAEGKDASQHEPEPEPSQPSPTSPAKPAAATPTSPRKSLGHVARVLSGSSLPRLSLEAEAFSRSGSASELPRVSLEAEAFSRPGSARLSLEADPSLPSGVRLSLDQESGFASPPRTSSPSPASPASPPSPPPTSLPSHTLAFDTADLGAGFATPFGPSSPRESPEKTLKTSLSIPEPSELRRSPSFGSDFGGFADPDDASAGWGDPGGFQDSPTSLPWKADTNADAGGGWGDAPRARPPSPPQKSQQELDWEAEQRRQAAADERAPHDKIMALRRGWEGVAEEVIGEDTLETSEEEERRLDSEARELEESTREALRGLTEVPDTSFAFGHSATREKYSKALARAPPNSMSLLRAPVRSRRLDNLDFGPGLEGWAARSRLGEPEAAQPVVEPEPEQTGWSFWRKNTPKPLVTSGGAVLEVKTDIDMGSASASVRGSKPGSISSRPGTPNLGEGRASISSSAAPRGSISASIGPSVHSTRGSMSGASPLSATLSAGAGASPFSATATTSSPLSTAPQPQSSQERKDAPAPSRMSRLFRWGRKPVETDDKEDKELELGENDFAFLDQVPSATGADLLGGMASIDEVLGPVKKEVPLPAPLAPPPRSSSSTGLSALSGSAASRGAKKNDFDLFASLDFDDNAPPAASTSAATSFGWDDLLAPSGPSTAPSVPNLAAPSAPAARTATPPIAPLRPTSASPPPRATFGSLSSPLSPASVTSPADSRPRYGPSGPALGAHSRHRSGFGSGSSVGMSPRVGKPPSPATRAPQAPAPVQKSQDFGFGDLAFEFDPPPSNSAPGSVGGSSFFNMAPLAPTPSPGLPSPSGSGMSGSMALLAPSPPPIGGKGMAALTPSPALSIMSSGSGSMAPLAPSRPASGMSGTSGMAALAPSPPLAQRTPSPFAIAPPPAASPIPPAHRQSPAAAQAAAPATVDDDFGDFGDFGSFDAAPAADDDFGDFGDFGSSSNACSGFDSFNTQPAQPTQPSGASGSFTFPPPPASRGTFSTPPRAAAPASSTSDGFGDLSSFGFPLTPAKPSAPSSLAPTPIAKSIPPTPIDKSPRNAPPTSFPSFAIPPPGAPGAALPPPGTMSGHSPQLSGSASGSGSNLASVSRKSSTRSTGGGASLSRNSSLTRTASHSPPVFARPAGLPTGKKSRQSSFADSPGSRAAVGAALATGSGAPVATLASRRTPSVDHRATLALMAAAQAADAASEDAPLSPVVEVISPPPGAGGFAGLIPPPPGGRRPAARGAGGSQGLIDLLDD